ncbi:MAG: ABC transporter permease [Candidatus Humimicrobiaceae bacterium]
MKRKMIVRDFLTKYGIVFVLLILVVLFSMTSRNFLTSENIFNILRQVAIIGIVSVGMTMVLITGGIDLSVGSVIGVACVLSAELLLAGVNALLTVIITLIISALLGLINAFFINKLNIPPLITTLGMMTTLRGVAYLITSGMPVYGFQSGIDILGKGYLWVIPIPVIIMIIIFALGILFLERSRYGRYIYGVGGNEEASRLSGINVKKIKYMAYAICSLLSGLAGIVLLARISSGTPKAGQGYEMDVITAVVLGGVSISGGEGRLGFVIVGVIIMGVLTNGMILLNIQEYVQWVIKGLVLIAAVGLDRFIQSKKLSIA